MFAPTNLTDNKTMMNPKLLLFLSLGWPAVLPAGAQQTTDTIRLHLQAAKNITLKEVEVQASKTPAGGSRFSDMHPVELVSIGGANGDLYKALQTLPGAQVQGESGHLLVRGGSSEETQTFIDGMHVLNPYTSTGINSPARSRYSTFLFQGINLATGGAPLEYGQALSAVLPLETKDSSPVSKLGINASVVGVGGGGTRAYDGGSLSLDLNYQDLGLYNRLFPGRKPFKEPYRMASAASQGRHTLPGGHLLKVYAQYDRTGFTSLEGEDNRPFALDENNVYLNATLRSTPKAIGWQWFAGAALSYFRRHIAGAATAGDTYAARRREVHLKAKATRRLLANLRLDMGVESYLRRYQDAYRLPAATDYRQNLSHALAAVFLSASYYPLENLKTEASARAEYASTNHHVEFSPRLAVNYYAGRFMLSATAGRYTQLPETRYLLARPGLKAEACTQFNAGLHYDHAGRFCKAEVYYKAYKHLALWENDVLTSRGYGHSKGADFFFRDPVSLKNFEYQLSYTYNQSRRKYAKYPALTTPQYATRHNASVVVKYSIPRLRTIVGLTNTCASGRPWHNPDRPGLMNDKARPYNSLDLGLTFIPHRKVIIHASGTNILCRRNEFGRVNGKPILASYDHFFYLGIFITLGKKAAYDISNF